MDKSNQWELNGDCTLCRRKKYCSNPCTMNKRYNKYLLNRAVAGVMMGRDDALKEYVDKTLDMMERR